MFGVYMWPVVGEVCTHPPAVFVYFPKTGVRVCMYASDPPLTTVQCMYVWFDRSGGAAGRRGMHGVCTGQILPIRNRATASLSAYSVSNSQ